MKSAVLKRRYIYIFVVAVLMCTVFLLAPQQAEARVSTAGVVQLEQLDSNDLVVKQDVHNFFTKQGTKLKINLNIPSAVTAAYLDVECGDTILVDGVKISTVLESATTTSYNVYIDSNAPEGSYTISLMMFSLGKPSGIDSDYANARFNVSHKTPIGPTLIHVSRAYTATPGVNTSSYRPYFEPSNINMTWFDFTSDNPDVCGALGGDLGGSLYPKKEGVATVTVTAENGLSTWFKVYVAYNPVVATSISLPGKATMRVGETLTLEPQFSPENTTVKLGFNWKSNNYGVATVDSDGVVTAYKPGTVTITVAAWNNEKATASCTITVTKPADPIDDPQDPNDDPNNDPDAPNDDPDNGATDDPVGNPNDDPNNDSDGPNGSVDDPENPEAATPKTVKTLSSICIVKGKTATLPVSIQPANVENKKVSWKSSSPKIVSIDKTTGKIKGLKVGKTTVTVTTDDGKKKAKCTVYVVAKTTKVKTLVAQKPIGLTVGKTMQVKVKTTPAKATGIVPKFNSSKKAVATIDKAGVITAKKLGKSVITIKAGGKTQKVIITVGKVLPKKVTLNKRAISIKVKAAYKLTAKLSPVKASPKTVTWTSSNKKVATVDKNGKVKGIKKGKATVTVTTWNGKSVKCTVIVR